MLSAFDQLISAPEPDRFRRWRLQEGLLSATWQAWCNFARSALLESAAGTTTVGGVTTTSAFAALSDAERRFVALQFSLNHKIKKVKPISGMHAEPTWGDFTKANRIAIGFSPSNQASLLSGFGSATLAIDLQLVRNTCAHITTENLDKLRRKRVMYSKTSMVHPSDAVNWIDPTTNSFAFRAWCLELSAVANQCVA